MSTRDAALRLEIREEPDVFVARSRAHALALSVGFHAGAAGAIATAVSEIARNIVVHAGRGELLLQVAAERRRRGIVVIARDSHPGIADVAAAMQDGYSTVGSLGFGLPGARRLMDEFALESSPGAGTTVTMKKWIHVRGE